MTSTLGRQDIYWIVNEYIGVDDGYLSGFTYEGHKEFYPYYCDLDINPLDMAGTTRSRFIAILETADANTQVKILRGILKKCPPNDESKRRTLERAEKIERLAAGLDGSPAVKGRHPRVTSEVVKRAIDDAETLIEKNGATSGVDRIHTALHGYLKAVCSDAGIDCGPDPSLSDVFKILREKHPQFSTEGPRAADITQLLRSLGAMIGTLNPLRNKASVAHPNESLLDEPEAMLVVNATRTVVQYLDSKLEGSS